MEENYICIFYIYKVVISFCFSMFVCPIRGPMSDLLQIMIGELIRTAGMFGTLQLSQESNVFHSTFLKKLMKL